MSEEKLQSATAKLLDHTGLIWCHPPNGGLRNVVVAKKLKGQGVKAGVPDVLIFNPTGILSGVAIELKVGRNKPSELQQEWIQNLTACNWATAVCRSIDEVIEVVRHYYPKHL